MCRSVIVAGRHQLIALKNEQGHNSVTVPHGVYLERPSDGCWELVGPGNSDHVFTISSDVRKVAMEDFRLSSLAMHPYPENIVARAESIDTAKRLLAAFLEGMPELGIVSSAPSVQAIVDDCHKGNVRAYILNSFEQFLDQCVWEEPVEE